MISFLDSISKALVSNPDMVDNLDLGTLGLLMLRKGLVK